jgi:hypothetical protein
MPKRKTESDAIEQALARLENTVYDRYYADRYGAGGHDADLNTADRRHNRETAIAPRDSSTGAVEAPERIRYKLEVQQHIRDRIAEPLVTAEEIIGTLASIMRGDITQMLDESGQIDFKLIKERHLSHLLKSVSVTVHHTEATAGKPASVTKKTSVQLHSPLQAAVALARLAGIDRRRRPDED